MTWLLQSGCLLYFIVPQVMILSHGILAFFFTFDCPALVVLGFVWACMLWFCAALQGKFKAQERALDDVNAWN